MMMGVFNVTSSSERLFLPKNNLEMFIQGVLGNEKFLFQFNLIYSGFLYLSLTLGSGASLILSLLDNIRKCNIITLWFHNHPLFLSPTNQHGVLLLSFSLCRCLWFLPLKQIQGLDHKTACGIFATIDHTNVLYV